MAGDVIEGKVSVGMAVMLGHDEKEKYKILGVEFVDKLSEKSAKIGLLLSLEDIRKNKKENKSFWEGKEVICN